MRSGVRPSRHPRAPCLGPLVGWTECRVKIELLEALEADGFELSEEVTADRAFLWCRCPKPPHQRQAPDTWDDPPEDIC